MSEGGVDLHARGDRPRGSYRTPRGLRAAHPALGLAAPDPMVALGDRTLAGPRHAELPALLAENETLFVEHKSNLREDAFNVSKAVASFANTMGGWVLIGVSPDGTLNAGTEGGWQPVEATAFVDRVRQVIDPYIDPMPPFAA